MQESKTDLLIWNLQIPVEIKLSKNEIAKIKEAPPSIFVLRLYDKLSY